MRIVIYDIYNYFKTYFLGAIICFLLVVVVSIFYYRKLVIMRIRRKQSLNILFISLFVAYLYIVLGITLFSREVEVYKVIKLLPFSTFGCNPFAIKYVVENILLFVPFGVFSWLLWKKKKSVKDLVERAIFASLCIECMQFFTRRGRFEVDDIMLNTLGAVIGWLLVRGITYIARFFLQNKSK